MRPVYLLPLLAACAPVPDESSTPTQATGSTSTPESLVGSPDVDIYGSVQQIFADGDFSATANLSTTGSSSTTVGLGVLSDLRGEVTILDGVSWLGFPDGLDAITVSDTTAPDEEATLLVVSEVDDWVTFTLDEDTTYDDLADAVAGILADAHWPDTGAVPLKITGAVRWIDWHVSDGTRLPEGQASHEDFDAAAVTGTLVEGAPVLIGFYSTQHGGIITHGGIRLHVHVIDAERGITGHVDDALIGAGATVSLPSPTSNR